MGKRRKLFAGIVALVAAVALVAFLSREREPVYGGKTLSQWVILLPRGPWPMKNDATAEDAIVHIGPPALPYLTKWIQYREPRTKGKLASAINDVRRKLCRILGRAISFDDQNTRAVGAAKAFCLIAPQTTNALRELGQLADKSAAAGSGTETFVISIRACYGLRDFRADGVPYLLQLLTNRQHVIAADVLGYMGTDAFPAIPALIQSLQSTKPGLPATAARALGRLHHDPNLVLPALAACLNSTNSTTRAFAINAIADFDTDALSTASSVRPMLADPDNSVRDAATNFFRAVDPKALAKAPTP